MTVSHAFYDLFEKCLCCFLVQSALFLYIFEQLSSFQKLHDDRYLHIFQCKTIVHLDYVLVIERFQNFCFNKNVIDVAY